MSYHKYTIHILELFLQLHYNYIICIIELYSIYIYILTISQLYYNWMMIML